jgi:hypothetical protein
MQVHEVGWILRDGGGIVDLSDSAASPTEVKCAGGGISETFGESAKTNPHAHHHNRKGCAPANPVDVGVRKGDGAREAYSFSVRSHGGYLMQSANRDASKINRANALFFNLQWEKAIILFTHQFFCY